MKLDKSSKVLLVKRNGGKKNKSYGQYYHGDLHVHTLNQPDDINLLVEGRIGSNCAQHTMEEVLSYLFSDLSLDYVAITNHSRDSSAKYMGQGLKDWLIDEGIPNDEVEKMAEKILNYGDARFLKEKELIERNCHIFFNKRIISGVEVNVLLDGKLDTDLVDAGFYEYVVASIHPWLFDQKLSPKKYQWMLESAINNRRVNVIAHIGYGMPEVLKDLDWDFIARECIANQVAIEINVQNLLTAMESIFLVELSTKKIISLLPDMVLNNIPIMSNQVMSKLSGYFPKGLRLCINTDLHRIANKKKIFSENKFQYCRLLLALEKELNKLFVKYYIESTNVINFLPVNDLQDFIHKRFYG
jgi:histidinol phosphatase-like PHP family hydrolase